MEQRCNFTKTVAFLSLVAVLVSSLFSFNVFAASKEKTAVETVKDMGIGWNLGNTLEACGDWINGKTVKDYETAWGNIVTTQAVIDDIKKAGFDSVRIPVAWSNLMASDYTINRELLNRVEEVVNYCLKNDMYAIVNIHWDNGWFENFATDYDESMKKYISIWTQLSAYYKDYPDTLIFESLNEEGCWNSIWNRYGGSSEADKARAYGILNNINQKFVDIVRASGGNNASRCLLIAGYATDIDLTCDDAFKMPKDTINSKLIVSVHYYTPSTFTILEKDESWGKCATNWGTAAEINQVKNDFNKMKVKFADRGVPVIIGEYGSTLVNKDPASVRLYISTVCKTAYDMGFCPVLWDPGTHYSRSERKFKDPQLASIFAQYKESNPVVTPTPTSNVKLGDVNGDGAVNSTDYSLLRRCILGIIQLTDAMSASGDMNRDGKVDSTDYALLKRHLLGI
jgi:endoglucanase